MKSIVLVATLTLAIGAVCSAQNAPEPRRWKIERASQSAALASYDARLQELELEARKLVSARDRVVAEICSDLSIRSGTRVRFEENFSVVVEVADTAPVSSR